MVYAVLLLVVIVGATIQSRRHRGEDGPARVVDVHLVWWLAAMVGVAPALGAFSHLFDGAATAEDIG